MLWYLIMEAIYTPLLSEDTIRTFLREAPRPFQKWHGFIFTFVPALLIAAILFFALNGASYFRLSQPEPIATQSTPAAVATIHTAAPPAATDFAAVSVPTPTPTPTIPAIPDNTVSLDTLGISAPISWNIPLDQKILLANLEKGVVHIAGTALPGQTGYVAIAGHSSNVIWDKGAYNSIFAPLTKAVVGQQVQVSYQNQVYTYRISKIFQVNPSDVSILTSDPQNSGLRLITCTPVGTSLFRLIVQAEQISPDPALNTPFTPHISGTNIPATR